MKIVSVIVSQLLGLALSISIGAQVLDDSKPVMTANLPEGEAVFTEEELKDYYEVYENEAVKYLRKVFDRYLKNPKSTDSETEHLQPIPKEYFESKFTVLSRNPDMFGNTHLMILFVDKPDKVFVASIYTGGDFRLGRFAEDSRFTKEDIRRLKIRYRRFLEDKKHVM